MTPTQKMSMWENFRDTLQTSLQSRIPHRKTRSKDGYPWIGPELKKLIRKQHSLYKLKKKTDDLNHKQRYLEIKHLVQRRTRQAYWNYVEHIVTRPQVKETEYTSMKRFWTYIKHKRSGNVGVSSFKSERKLYPHPFDKTELLNKQFWSVFTSSDEVSREDFVHSSKYHPQKTTFL